MDNISEQVKAYIVENCYDESEGALNDEMPLISSGIIDSITILEVVDFLESTFNIEFLPHEVDQSNLNTIALIENFVKSKQK